MKLNFNNHRFPPIVIMKAIRLYIKYKLSLRDISELLLEIDINVSRESIRKWLKKFCPQITQTLKEKNKSFGKKWFLDEVYIKIENKWRYIYRCVDEHMNIIDIHVSKHRNKKSAKMFLEKCLATYGKNPTSIKSDSHVSYNQIRDLFPKSNHIQVKCLNNKAESSHVPVKQRYRPMRGFKNFSSARIFLNCFEQVYCFFRKFKCNNKKTRILYEKKLVEFNNCFV